MARNYRRPATRLGLGSHVPAEAYEQRTKPARNRVRAEPAKVKTSKPRAHRVGRSKR